MGISIKYSQFSDMLFIYLTALHQEPNKANIKTISRFYQESDNWDAYFLDCCISSDKVDYSVMQYTAPAMPLDKGLDIFFNK